MPEVGKRRGRFGYRLYEAVTKLHAASNTPEARKRRGGFGYRL